MSPVKAVGGNRGIVTDGDSWLVVADLVGRFALSDIYEFIFSVFEDK